jgi:hypothetical protein
MSANTLNNTTQLLNAYNGLNVAIISTKHFRDALEDRVFPLNVIGNAAIIAQSMRVGEIKEVFTSTKFKATVELKKVSHTVAILITGWKGVRNSKKIKE